jgi:hypothetical protein
MPSKTAASFWIRSKLLAQGARFASLVLRKSLLRKSAQLVTCAGEALLPSSFVRQRCEDLRRNGILFGLRQSTNLLKCLFKQGGHVFRLSLRYHDEWGAWVRKEADARKPAPMMPCCVHSTYAGK